MRSAPPRQPGPCRASPRAGAALLISFARPRSKSRPQSTCRVGMGRAGTAPAASRADGPVMSAQTPEARRPPPLSQPPARACGLRGP